MYDSSFEVPGIPSLQESHDSFLCKIPDRPPDKDYTRCTTTTESWNVQTSGTIRERQNAKVDKEQGTSRFLAQGGGGGGGAF